MNKLIPLSRIPISTTAAHRVAGSRFLLLLASTLLLSACDKEVVSSLFADEAEEYFVELEPVQEPEPVKAEVSAETTLALKPAVGDVVAANNNNSLAPTSKTPSDNSLPPASKQQSADMLSSPQVSSVQENKQQTSSIVTNANTIDRANPESTNNLVDRHKQSSTQEKPRQNSTSSPASSNTSDSTPAAANAQPNNKDSKSQQTSEREQAPADLVSAQVTKVTYNSPISQQQLVVTFHTAATGALKAIASFEGKNITMIAENDGGNNPIYSSADRAVEMITYGGGGSIDLLINGSPVQFDAISADASVVSDVQSSP